MQTPESTIHRQNGISRVTFYRIAIILVILGVLMTGCTSDSDQSSTLLDRLVDDNAVESINELVACAAGGNADLQSNLPTRVFFYPELDARDMRLYLTEDPDDDPEDLSLFVESDLTHLPVFNGFLRKFELPVSIEDKWARVAFRTEDRLWYSKPIKLQLDSNSTLYDPELCEVNLVNPLEPSFTWEVGEAAESVIFFHVISDENGDARSGTYTTDHLFQYYNLDNVVFNVTRAGQATPLIAGETYNFTLMGVGGTNWVNLIVEKSFVAE